VGSVGRRIYLGGKGRGDEETIQCFLGPRWSVTGPFSERMAGHDKLAYS